MVVLGIDPGPTQCGWALVMPGAAGRAAVLALGKAAPAEIPTSTGPHRADLVGLEWPAGYQPRRGGRDLGRTIGQAAQIAATSLVAGELAGRLGCSLPVVRLSAREVRRALCGAQNATDKDVGYWLALLVEMPARSNSHTRDAIAVGLAAWRRWSFADAAARRAAGWDRVLP